MLPLPVTEFRRLLQTAKYRKRGNFRGAVWPPYGRYRVADRSASPTGSSRTAGKWNCDNQCYRFSKSEAKARPPPFFGHFEKLEKNSVWANGKSHNRLVKNCRRTSQELSETENKFHFRSPVNEKNGVKVFHKTRCGGTAGRQILIIFGSIGQTLGPDTPTKFHVRFLEGSRDF